MACREAERSLDERLKPVLKLDDFESPEAAWKPQRGEQNAQAEVRREQRITHDGQGSLRVDFEFSGRDRLEYVAIERALELPADAAGVGFWLHRGTAPLSLAVRIADRSGEVHQFGLEESAGSDWRFAAGLFAAGESWGGDGNRRLDPPLQLHSLVFDRPAVGWRGSGHLYVDDLVLVQPSKTRESLQIEVHNRRFGNVYVPGETVELRARSDAGLVSWRVEDYWGRMRAEFQQGTARDVSMSFRLPEAGFFAVRFDSVHEEGSDSRVFRCAALEPFTPPRDAFAGFCSHYGQRAYPLESMELLKQYGFLRYRDEIAWSSVERERGRYVLPDFAAEYLGRSRELGMEPLIIFDYANRLYDNGGYPNSQEAIDGFAAYARELAVLAGDAVHDFEIWNEWIGGCGMQGRPGDHGPEAYGRLMKATYAAVRAARPDAVIVGIGGEYGPDCAENIERAIRVGGADSMDAYSIHPYRYPRPPEASDLVGDVRKVADRAVAAGANDRMWITEIGWPTHLGRAGVDERTQARYAVRTMALLQTCPSVEKVYWYDFKDDGLQREYNEHNFGVVLHQHFNCAPKPAAVALGVFARMTAEAQPVGLWHEGPLFAAEYRRPDGIHLLVAWTSGDPVHAASATAAREVFDTMGNRAAEGSNLALSPDPVYLFSAESLLPLVP